MQIEELNDIMQAVSKFDLSQMEIQDQLSYISSALQFAETMKPLVIKYADKLPEDIKLFLKL